MKPKLLQSNKIQWIRWISVGKKNRMKLILSPIKPSPIPIFQKSKVIHVSTISNTIKCVGLFLADSSITIFGQCRGGRCSLFLTMRCFNDVMFPNSYLDVFDDVWKKNQNIMLTMHINDVFQTIKKIPTNFIRCFKYQLRITELTFKIWIVYLRHGKSYPGLHFWLNNQTFAMALYGVPKT